MVAGSAGFPASISYTVLLIRVPDCCPVVVDWWKGQVGGCCAKQVRWRVDGEGPAGCFLLLLRFFQPPLFCVAVSVLGSVRLERYLHGLAVVGLRCG